MKQLQPVCVMAPLAALIITALPLTAAGKVIVEWDFTKGTHGWAPNARVEPLRSTTEGLIVKATGLDPWIEGPAVDYPTVELVRVTVRMKSTADRGAEIFYGRSFKAGDEVHFTVQNDGQWHDYPVLIRAKLGPKTRLRLDPCHDAGELVVASIKVEALEKIEPPTLDKPSLPTGGTPQAVIRSGNLTFEHYGKRWGNFSVKVDGKEMAIGYDSQLIGLVNGNTVEWLNLKNATVTVRQLRKAPPAVIIKATLGDTRGAKWDVARSVIPGQDYGPGSTLIVNTVVSVSRDTDVVSLPGLTLFSDVGTFGERKNQAVFAGLEYLCDEPSSSDADIAKPNHIRRTPDGVKITFPFMAIQHEDRYIGLIWDRSDRVAATFDSPDRIYNSGGHVMALSSPGIGNLRFENDLVAHSPFKLKANQPADVSAMIIASKGKTIIPAVKQYVDIRGLPELPQYKGGFEAAVNLLAHGWLDSAINEDSRFRHAVWGTSFGARPAADAAVYMDWLADHTNDTNLQKRLTAERDKALSRLPPQQPFSSGVSHVRPPNAPLVFGRVNEYVQARRQQALGQLSRFDAKGLLHYRIGKQDYSRTHFAKHANGYAANTVASILEAATLSGDKELAKQAVELLDKQTAAYAGAVPRGAQTWEIPLHTPDILASAYMIKSYVLGYLLTDRQDLLQEAKYWAWTGVPFLYLDNPTDGEVGPYATIAVLGATNWRAPVWFGKPVQWCGLVYCSALHDLAAHDPEGPWEKIAKGITAAGLQMTWPTTDSQRQGLLPDFFFLVEQAMDGPAINPGTVGAHLPELYDAGTMYDLKKLPKRRWLIHAPCTISDIRENAKEATLAVDGWGKKTFYVLISRITNKPAQISVRPQGSPNAPYAAADVQYHTPGAYAVIKLKGASQIRLK